MMTQRTDRRRICCYRSTMTTTEAEKLLDGTPLVAAIAGSIPDMKALRDRCLQAGIPAIVGCPPGAGKG
jgi:hypothetical protein